MDRDSINQYYLVWYHDFVDAISIHGRGFRDRY